MDGRTKRMIDTYIPHPRDETLGPNEYYYRQYTNAGDRVIKVVVREILPQKKPLNMASIRNAVIVWFGLIMDGVLPSGV